MSAIVDSAGRLLDTDNCTCVYSCADDFQTGCSLSGEWHVHPSEFPGDGFGHCAIHPDAPGDL